MAGKRIAIKILKWAGRILLIIIGLLVIVWFLLQTSPVQNFLKDKATTYLSNKLKTKVSIGKVHINFLYRLELNDVYLEDQQHTPLLKVKTLEVDYKLLDLLDKQLTVSKINIDDVYIRLYRSVNDTTFNFDFIGKAFASEPDKTPEKDTLGSGSSLKFAMGKLNLSKVYFLFDDAYTGQKYLATAKSLNANIKTFDLDSLKFGLEYLYTDGISTSIGFVPGKTIKSTDTSTSSGIMPVITADSIQLLSSNVVYSDSVGNTFLTTSAPKIGASGFSLDLNKMFLQVKNFVLNDHKSSLLLAAAATKKDTVAIVKDTVAGKPFTFAIKNISIANNDVQYDGNVITYKAKNSIDYDHLHLQQLNAAITNLSYDGANYKADIHNITAKEQSGFNLQQLTGKLAYGEKEIQFQDAVVKTNNSILQADIATYNSFSDLSNVIVEGKIHNTSISINDALYFSPDLAKNENFKPLLGKIVHINADINGPVNNLFIHPVIVQEGATKLNATAKITGLPDSKKLNISLLLNEFSGTRESLLSYLPKGTLPSSIQVPDRFTLKGTYKGSLNDLAVDMQLLSTDGNLKLKGNMKNFSDSKKAVYDMAVSSDNLRLDKILKDKSYGNTALNIHVKGTGFDPQTANAVFEGDVKRIKLMGYSYTNAKINGNIRNQKLTTTLNLNDPNAQADISLEYGLDPKNPTLKSTGSMVNINLQKLGFTKDEMIFTTKLDADFESLDMKALKGNATLNDVKLSYNGKMYNLQSFIINADHRDNKEYLSVKSPILNADINGEYELASISIALMNVINHHIDPDFIAPAKPVIANVDIKGTLHYQDFMQSFVPDLKELHDISFQGSLRSATNELNFTTAVPFVRYADYTVDSFKFSTTTVNDTLAFQTGFLKLSTPSFFINKDLISGGFNRGTLNWSAAFLDNDDRYKYRLSGNFYNGKEKKLHLDNNLILNRDTWTTNPDNIVQFLSNGNFGGNLLLAQANHSLQILSDDKNTFPVQVKFKNFPINVVTKMVEMDSTLVDGYITGNVQFDKIDPFTFSSDLRIDSLTSYQYEVGTLTTNIHTSGNNIYSLTAKLEGNGNDVSIKGDYDNNATGKLDATVSLNPFKLKSVQPFVKDYISGLKGELSGDIKVTGTMDKPSVNGTLHFDSTALVYNEYNSYVAIPNSDIVFNNHTIEFNNFTMYDSLNNKATIKGKIRTPDYRNYAFGLTINTKHFLAIQGQSRPEQKYYGPAYITALINVSGTSQMPDISGQLKVDDKSQLTIVLPPDDAGVGTEEGIVKFVDKDLDTLKIAGKIKDTTIETSVTALKLEMNVEITPTSTFTIVMDQDNGDYLKAKGTAALSVVMNRDGKLMINGDYLVEEGEYELSMSQVIKRKFIIQKGSSIKWDGKPTGAQMNITALYVATTTAAELVANQQNSINPVTLNNQKYPFQVFLILQDEMLKPKVSFKLDMYEKDQNIFSGIVYARIKQINQDESQLNKQVMSLLVLNHFITDDPLSSLSGGNSFADNLELKARATAGKILTQQLNNLASQLIKGVDINFDLDSKNDYTTGSKQGQTDLGVSVTKNLFNDRLTATVGSTFAVEGSEEYKSQAAGFGGDISLEYKITKDGRYRVKFYRRNDYDAIITAQVIETGVSFVIVMDFDKFKEIVQKKKEEEEKEAASQKEKTKTKTP